MAQLSQFGLRVKAWLSHYGLCQRALDLATSRVTEAFGQCHYSAKCWPLITQMSARMAQRSLWVCHRGNEGRWLLTHWSEATCLWKHKVLSKYSSDEEKNAEWAKCGSDEMRSKLVTWQSHVFPLKPLTCSSCQIGPRLWQLYWRRLFFLDSLEKKKVPQA